MFFLHVFICTICMPGALGVRRGCPGTAATDGCKPPCGSWELNPVLRKQGLLTADPFLSLAPRAEFRISCVWSHIL